jgi:hypothetical protein
MKEKRRSIYVISKVIGTIWSKNTKTKVWWVKLGVCLVLSNLFFFLCFSGAEEVVAETGAPIGWVEAQVEAKLLTPFQEGKRVLLVHRAQGRQVSALLKTPMNQEGRLTLMVEEAVAPILFQLEGWEVLPFMKNLVLRTESRGAQHEIRY